MPLSQLDLDRAKNPLDIIERIAAHNRWSFDRDEEDEIPISVAGGWSEYNIAFTWLAEVEALHVACAFDLKVPAARLMELASLVSLINEQLWIGHFDIWPNDGVIMFRHAILLAGGAELNGDPERTVATTLNVSIPGVDSEAAIVALKDVVALSIGSACTSQSYEPSHVLLAAGLPRDRIEGALRLSWGPESGAVPIDALVERLRHLVMH